MAIEWEKGLPILTNDSLLSEVPAYTQLLAENVSSAAGSPVGAVTSYVGDPAKDDAPDGWLYCDGSDFDGNAYPQLSSLLGMTKTPAMQGRVIVGHETGDSLFGDVHNYSGQRNAIIPYHNHGAAGSTYIGSHTHSMLYNAENNVYGCAQFVGGGPYYIHHMPHTHSNVWMGGHYTAVSVDLGTPGTSVTVHHAGEDVTNKNLQPYYVLSYIIKHD